MDLASQLSTPEADDVSRLPLCVDLDGNLLRIDTLHEAAVAVLLADWRTAFR
jgi:hypothetical protein